jgi:hypothetical protein
MAELNFNALIPQGPRGFYQGFEQGQDQRIVRETNQIKLDELKRDRDEMIQLQEKLKGLGQDPDVGKFLDTLAQTGKPDYVKMAIEGRQKIKDLDAYAKLGVIEPVGAAPAMPTGAPALAAPASVVRMPQAPAPVNALGSGTFGMGQPTAPVNAMAPTAPAAAATPVNALAAQPTAQIAQAQQRIDQLVNFARTNPRMAKQAMDEAKFLQDQLEFASKRAPAAPTKIQEYEYAKRNGYQGSFTDFTTLHAPRTTVNVPVNVSTEKKYGERFGGLIADADAAKLSAAESAPAAAANADRIIDLISTGKVITGTGANVRLQMAKALNLAGGNDSEKVRNTEVLISSLAETTLGAIKSSNLGAGQGFTNADRDFLEKAKAGQLTYDAKSLTELARLSRLAAEKSAESWNKRSASIPKSALEGTGISTEPVIIPPRKVSSVMNIPTGAIEMLKSGAGTREQFDAQFGPGSADRVLPKGR